MAEDTGFLRIISRLQACSYVIDDAFKVKFTIPKMIGTFFFLDYTPFFFLTHQTANIIRIKKKKLSNFIKLKS